MKNKYQKHLLSVIIPAYNEEKNILATVNDISTALETEKIPFEVIVVNDNSTDTTEQVLKMMQKKNKKLRYVNRTPPGGFGRAIRTGLDHFSGDYVVIVMADSSDDPADIVRYYNKIKEGYDAVFGSRFTKGAIVTEYPKIKLFVNRIVNKCIQLLFWTQFNDLTNAFKIFRAEVIQSILPLYSSHFNITIEISLSVLIRKYRIAQIPINWYGRKWGASNLRIGQMGRRYLATLLKIWFERILIIDDVLEETKNKMKNKK